MPIEPLKRLLLVLTVVLEDEEIGIPVKVIVVAHVAPHVLSQVLIQVEVHAEVHWLICWVAVGPVADVTALLMVLLVVVLRLLVGVMATVRPLSIIHSLVHAVSARLALALARANSSSKYNSVPGIRVVKVVADCETIVRVSIVSAIMLVIIGMYPCSERMIVFVVGVRRSNCVLRSSPLLMAFSRMSHFVMVTVAGAEVSVELTGMDITELMVSTPLLIMGIVPPVEFQSV